jgi:hypothetical protein
MRLVRIGSIKLALLASVTLALLAIVGVAPALALSPALSVNTVRSPKNLPLGGTGTLKLEVVDLGDAPAVGGSSPIVIADRLPEGLTATAASGPGCELITPHYVRCESGGTAKSYSPYTAIHVEISVEIANDASATLVNETSAGGGGAPTATSREALPISNAPAGFGVEKLQVLATNEDGTLDTQAGSHPFQLTTTVQINTEHTKDLRFNLPAGLVGNPEVIPRCTNEQFEQVLEPENMNACPPHTAIGVAIVYAGALREEVPVFNLKPSVGEPARFGFSVEGYPVILDTSVRTGGDYGVVVSVNNLTEAEPFVGARVSFWGVPGSPVHDETRGWACILTELYGHQIEEEYPITCSTQNLQQTPFLTLPTSCSGPSGMSSTVDADSWLAAGKFDTGEYTPLEGLDGCNHLRFEPTISAAPDGQAASTPTGLTVGVHVAQEGALNPTGLAPADVRDTTVALPAGVQVSPSGADGLAACSNAQIGFIGLNAQTGADEFTPDAPSCPDASKIATVQIKTPLLANALEGAVYLAAPQNFAGPLENPFSSLVAMYIVAKDPVSGVLVKLPGSVSLDGTTGQITASFENTPQLPFEDLELHFFGSARAPLSTPPACGTYTTQTSIAPWSGTEAVSPSSHFEITSGPNGAPCSNPQPFTPGFEAGSTNLQAGAFTPFTLTMSRPDADQTLSRIEMQFPPGLLGTLSNVKLCGEPQASQGACSEESLIGHTVVSAGLGNDPYTVTGGKVFITTGYKGAPYGLSILNPAKAGPFDLGTVVVRASVFVDPHTAALKIVSDPLPTILDGIPLQIQHVNVTVDRSNFTFNPTNCNKTQIGATLTSTEGVAAPASTSFQVTNCRALEFKPKFAVSTSAKTSRANGASLHVRLTYPNTPQGTEANIRSVKVDLPKQLVSRLSTLQHACLDSVFNSNPASCPAASRIGTAKALTPVIPVSLTGPVYFVSHGGAKFPELVVVLSGYGVTVQLDSETFISKAGITSSTFRTIPDVPVGAFELTLPEGPSSALAANGNLCKVKGGIKMPTAFTAQNGAVIKQSTPIGVTGCPKHKTAKTKTKGKNKK